MARARPIIGVTPDMPFGAFAARVIAVRADEAKALLTRNSAGPDLVHDKRVAVRRLRTAVEVFEPALPRKDARQVRRELKALFSGYGDRRDADVQIALLRSMEPSLTAADAPGFKGLIAALDASGGRDPGAASLPAEVHDLELAARSANGGAAAAVMEKIAAKRLAAVRKQLGAEDPDELHQLRIAAKRLRYVLEVARPVAGNGVNRHEAAARSVQDVLGEIHDCDVLLPLIREHRRELRDADVVAIRAGRRAPNAMRYRGVQAIETRVRARREDLYAELAGQRERWEKALA